MASPLLSNTAILLLLDCGSEAHGSDVAVRSRLIRHLWLASAAAVRKSCSFDMITELRIAD
jgi:hypothetical protein